MKTLKEFLMVAAVVVLVMVIIPGICIGLSEIFPDTMHAAGRVVGHGLRDHWFLIGLVLLGLLSLVTKGKRT